MTVGVAPPSPAMTVATGRRRHARPGQRRLRRPKPADANPRADDFTAGATLETTRGRTGAGGERTTADVDTGFLPVPCSVPRLPPALDIAVLTSPTYSMIRAVAVGKVIDAVREERVDGAAGRGPCCRLAPAPRGAARPGDIDSDVERRAAADLVTPLAAGLIGASALAATDARAARAAAPPPRQSCRMATTTTPRVAAVAMARPTTLSTGGESRAGPAALAPSTAGPSQCAPTTGAVSSRP